MRVRVDPIACTGHGACAELLPELIALDDWGYPIVRDDVVPSDLEAHARRAAAACPTLALLLQRESARSASRRRSSKRGGAA